MDDLEDTVKRVAEYAKERLPDSRLIIISVSPAEGAPGHTFTWETPGMDDSEAELRLLQLYGLYFDKRRAALKEAANG